MTFTLSPIDTLIILVFFKAFLATDVTTGKGHYTGSVTKNFSITAKKGSRFAAGAYKPRLYFLP